MAKKYLSLEEAAAMLGLPQAALKKARESGDLRGFADRGNWKFREEDVQEYGRSRQADSDPELPMLPESKPELTLNFGGSDSNVLSEDDDIGEQPTIIRKAGDSNILSGDSDLMSFGEDEGASDSGVRLVLDSNITGGDGSGSNILSDSSKEIPISFGDSSAPMVLSDSSKDVDGEGSSAEIPISFGDSSQDLVLAIDDDDDDSRDSLKGMGDSDSDVRLAVDLDSAALADSSGEILLSSRSDSDVRLLGKTTPMKLDPASDSDVRLIKTGSDSDVKLLPSDSDSDVRLLPSKKSSRLGRDSDVSLAGGAKRSRTVIDDDDEDLSGDGALMLGEGSGIRLDTSSDSGISLDSGSGISLDMGADSGIALDTGTDSNISLAMDDDDEGLTLDPGGDSGIALDLPDDSGLSLDSASMEATIPLMKVKGKSAPAKRKSDPQSETLISIPAMGGDDDEGAESDTDFELGTLEGDSNTSDTSVLLFDDEDDADDRAATMIKKKNKPDETFDLDDAGGDEFEDIEEEELVGEDDELEEAGEDFMADDDDFEDSVSTGESQSEFAAPVVGVRAAVEHEWGPIVFAMTLLSSVAMLVCAGVMFDLVRYLWRSGEYGTVAGPIIQSLGLK